MIYMMILAAYGWLLLVPPVKQINSFQFEVDLKQPWTEWEQRGAYDTAKECEIEREQLRWDEIREIGERTKKQSSTGTEKSEEKTEEKKDTFKPSKYLTKLQSDLTAALDRIKAAGCEDPGPLLDKECKAKWDDFFAKGKLIALQTER